VSQVVAAHERRQAGRLSRVPIKFALQPIGVSHELVGRRMLARDGPQARCRVPRLWDGAFSGKVIALAVSSTDRGTPSVRRGLMHRLNERET
jgi:hypothetical protein